MQDALSDNREIRKLLGQLERTPKDDENFLSKVMELRKPFQQHVRDEKKELLPAVTKALSDEEAETILANIEDEKAEIEAVKRAEAEQRRAEARQEAEQVESVQRTAEEMANTVTALAEGAELTANTTQERSAPGWARPRKSRNVRQITSSSCSAFPGSGPKMPLPKPLSACRRLGSPAPLWFAAGRKSHVSGSQ